MTTQPLATLADRAAETPGFILERTARRMKQFVQQELQASQADITVDQWVVLQEVGRADGLSQQALAQAVFKDPPTLTRIIDLLCAKGLTQRHPDPTDRRRFSIALTPAGQAKLAEVLPTVKNARRHAWGALADDEMATLVELLDRVFQHLQP